MAEFSRPSHALTVDQYNELPEGSPIWVVYGHLVETPAKPNESAHYKKMSNTCPFRNHPEYDDIHKDQADHLVFNLVHLDQNGEAYSLTDGNVLEHMTYVDDFNMDVNYSHNDNYIFSEFSHYYEATRYFSALNRSY